MKNNILFVLFILLSVCSCSEPEQTTEDSSVKIAPVLKQVRKTYQIGAVYADNAFAGARLSDFTQVDEHTYRALIRPENTPLNNSPYYAFRLWSDRDSAITINLEIAYSDDYKNRYIPKRSTDGDLWEPMEDTSYQMDTASGVITLQLSLTPDKLWIAAQEVISTQRTTDWSDSLSQRPFVRKEKIAESIEGKAIDLLTIDQGNASQSILLIGRQHPPEVPGGTIALESFVHAILADSELARTFRNNFKIYVFPLLNPDGADQGHWRHNANGVDLNRDWQAFTQPETQAVRDWMSALRKNNPIEKFWFGIDFHTSYSGPYLLTLDTLPHKVTPVITSEWIQGIEASTAGKLDIRPRAQSLPYCYNWMINEGGMEAITYEEGDEVDRSVIRKRAELYANTLMRLLLER